MPNVDPANSHMQPLKPRTLLAAVLTPLLVIGVRNMPATAVDALSLPTSSFSWQWFTSSDGLPHESIHALHAHGDHLWIGTDRGLARWDGAAMMSWNRADGFPPYWISAIQEDDQTHDVWLGTWGGGLVRFSGGRFDRFDQFNSGLAGNLVFALSEAAGRIWAATNGGLCSFDIKHDKWDLYAERRADTPETAVIGLFRQGDGLYMASWCGSLCRFSSDRDEWLRVVPTLKMPRTIIGPRVADAEPTLAVAASSESLWCATANQLWRRGADGRWLSHDLPAAIAGRVAPQCLAARSDSEVWVGTDEGVHVLVSDSRDDWVRYGRKSLETQEENAASTSGGKARVGRFAGVLPDDRIRCIAFLKEKPWIGTPSGLLCGSIGTLSCQQPLPERHSEPCFTLVEPLDAASDSNQVTSVQPPAADDCRAIAVFAPLTRLIAIPGENANAHSARMRLHPTLSAVQCAVEYANNGGGFKESGGVQLITGREGFGHYGWGTPEDDLAFFATRPDVTGITASLGPERRIATAVLLKTELPVINCANSPPDIDEDLNPWVFRCPSNDPRLHERLLDFVFDELHADRTAVLRTPGMRTNVHLDWWIAHARRRGHAPVIDRMFDPNSKQRDAVLNEVRACNPSAVLTWADADATAAILRRVRSAGMNLVLVGSDQIVCERFIQRAGANAGSVVAFCPCRHRQATMETGAARQHVMTARPPSMHDDRAAVDAASWFDGTLHLLEAMDRVGPDRRRVRDALRGMSALRIARLVNGKWESGRPITAYPRHWGAVDPRPVVAPDGPPDVAQRPARSGGGEPRW